MTDPDFASFGEPSRTRPEGYRLTQPREEPASGSAGALAGFDPGRGSLGRPEVAVGWAPADIAPDWATGTSAEASANGANPSFGRAESLTSAPDSVAIPRQSDTEFSAFLSPYAAETPQTSTPVAEFTPNPPLTGADSAFSLGAESPSSSPGLPQRTPGHPQYTAEFEPTTEHGYLFGETAAGESESAHGTNGSAPAFPESGRRASGARDTSRLTNQPAPDAHTIEPTLHDNVSPLGTTEPNARTGLPSRKSGLTDRQPERPVNGFTAPAVHGTEPPLGTTEPRARPGLPSHTPHETDGQSGHPTGFATPGMHGAESANGLSEPAARTGLPNRRSRELATGLPDAAETPYSTAEPARQTAAGSRATADHEILAAPQGATRSANNIPESAYNTTEPGSRNGLPTRSHRASCRSGSTTTEFAITGTLIAESPSPLADTPTPPHDTPPQTTGSAPRSASPGLGATPPRRSAHRRAAQDDTPTPTSVDVNLVMHLLLSSHNLETVADKAEAGEASLEDFICAARRTRTATVDLVTAWFGGPNLMRQFAEALLAASQPT